jgi:hypothetical protein
LYDQLDQGAPVWHYEVTEALGSAIAEWIVLHDGLAPSRLGQSLPGAPGREFMLRGSHSSGQPSGRSC